MIFVTATLLNKRDPNIKSPFLAILKLTFSQEIEVSISQKWAKLQISLFQIKHKKNSKVFRSQKLNKIDTLDL